MAQTMFIVMRGEDATGEPDAIFSSEAAAATYVTRQNNLEKQRHPRWAKVWRAYPLEVDARVQ